MCRICCWPSDPVSFVWTKMFKCVQSAGATATMFILPFLYPRRACAYKPWATVCTLCTRVHDDAVSYFTGVAALGQIQFARPFSRYTNGQCWCNLLATLDGTGLHIQVCNRGDKPINSADGGHVVHFSELSFYLLIADWKYLMIIESDSYCVPLMFVVKRDRLFIRFISFNRKVNGSCLLIFCGGCRPARGQRQHQPPECRPLSRSLAGSAPPVSGVD